MAGSERENYVRGTRAERIRALNDDLRTHGAGGLLTITRRIAALGPELLSNILAAVREFDAFDTRNDPYGEHDLGILQVGGRSILWKIDYYDADRLSGSPDPADRAVTCRVLTIMLADEY
jgi:hypothetical protein